MPDAIVLTTEFHERDLIPLVNLLRAYEKGLGVSLCFQDFDAEIAGLPGDYAPPGGALILAHAADGNLVGTVALRALDPAQGICEMKRLYVAPEGRGHGLGRRLAERALTEAQRLGYRAVRLDTWPAMREALERRLGILGGCARRGSRGGRQGQRCKTGHASDERLAARHF